MPKADWKEVLEATSKEAQKPILVETDSSDDTDLDGIPEKFEDADEEGEMMSEDDMSADFEQLQADTKNWTAVRMRGKDVLILCLFPNTPNQKFWPFTWIQIHGLCFPVQWQFKEKREKQTMKKMMKH